MYDRSLYKKLETNLLNSVTAIMRLEMKDAYQHLPYIRLEIYNIN